MSGMRQKIQYSLALELATRVKLRLAAAKGPNQSWRSHTQSPALAPTQCRCPSLTPSNRRVRDPYARWCGRGGTARCPPIPIFDPKPTFPKATRLGRAGWKAVLRYCPGPTARGRRRLNVPVQHAASVGGTPALPDYSRERVDRTVVEAEKVWHFRRRSQRKSLRQRRNSGMFGRVRQEQAGKLRNRYSE